MHCKEEIDEAELKTFHSFWQSFRPKPNGLVKKQRANELGKDDLDEENRDETLGRLVSAPKVLLRLKYTGPSSGWTIELTKDACVGEYCLFYKSINAQS